MKRKSAKYPSNLQIAKLFRSVSAALELSPGDNRFRIAAYDRAADSIEHASSDLKDLWDDNRLSDLPGVGTNMAEHLDELFKTGAVKHFEILLKPFPPAMFELLEVPGIGPKKAFSLCKALGLSKSHTAIKELEKAAKRGHIASIDGFGPDSEAQILQNIREFKDRSKRMLLPVAEKIAADLVAWMLKNPAVKQADALGSLRRKSATVGDIDIAVSTTDPQAAIHHFVAYPRLVRVIESGPISATILLPDNISVDLLTGMPERYGSLLQHFTGSKLHNIALRELALKKGLSLSEYGIKSADKTIPFKTETDFYHHLGLQYIPPEIREGAGEIELAESNRLPELIELTDIRGDLHVHSDINVEPSHDLGTSSISELAKSAGAVGYEYLGLTEHNPSFSQHNVSQIVNLIKHKTQQINEFNQDHENKHENVPYIFNGLEIDIRPDGSRALPDICLDDLDYACVSVHNSFKLGQKTMTDRVLAGLDHPKVKFFAHPTGRLIGQREGINLDWDRIFDYCLTHDKWLEINSSPDRLDLPDTLVRQARAAGIKLVINTDSHSAAGLGLLRFGVWVARRGFVQSADVVNTQPFAKLVKILGKEVT
jgi:DNA polymerase (family 10)